jgi:acetate kinase
MRVLVINSGSSSIKFQLIDMSNRHLLAKGLIERIGLETGKFNYTPAGGQKRVEEFPIPDHKVGLQHMLEALLHPEHGVISKVEDIDAVGHRIVHGGDKITCSVILDEAELDCIRECTPLAPLHNPANLMGVEALRELLPASTPHVGAFDTAFHAAMPPESYLYAIPYEFYSEHRIRRFGFHGTSHQYVAGRAAERLGIPADQFQCVTVHLGNGSSITAVKGGHSVDTSLGFGTLCGVPMGTRSGDVDPAIVLHMLDELKMTTDQVHDILYKKSGVLGLSGLSSDLRDVEDAYEKGDERCRIALEVLAHGIAKYILASTASLDRLDAVVFTAGIGERSPIVRGLVADRLRVLGVKLDAKANEIKGEEIVISTPESAITLLVVPTDEEMMIAIDTERLAKKSCNCGCGCGCK